MRSFHSSRSCPINCHIFDRCETRSKGRPDLHNCPPMRSHTSMNLIRLRSVMAFLPLVLPLCAAGAEYIAYIGTSGGQNSKGIYAFRFDSKSGKLNPLGLV